MSRDPFRAADVRLAAAADVDGAARLAATVALEDDDVIGYTRLGLVESDAPAPDGYYLVGLIVDTAHRRRGVAEALVTRAMEEAVRHADELWSFHDVENGASAALHARLGFLEVARGQIGFPGLGADSRDVLVRVQLR